MTRDTSPPQQVSLVNAMTSIRPDPVEVSDYPDRIVLFDLPDSRSCSAEGSTADGGGSSTCYVSEIYRNGAKTSVSAPR